MKLRLEIEGLSFTATADRSAASHDLISMLPLTITMADHMGVEKTGPLPQALSLDGQPVGTEPQGGDLGYYAPSQQLVLYYGKQSYYPGIVVIGRLDQEVVDYLAKTSGSVRVKVTQDGN